MTLSSKETPKTFANRLACLQNRAWLPLVLLLLALSSVLLLDNDHRGYFYKNETHNHNSAKTLEIADNLSVEHRFLMFLRQSLDPTGKPVYRPYNRFPIGGFALIKLTILPFGENLSAKIYAARMLTLLCFAAAVSLAYLSLCRIASNRWIALTAVLLAFSSIYCLYYSDLIQNEVMIDLFAVLLVFHALVIFEQEGRFLQLLLKTCAALLLGWHVYALLLPFIALGMMRQLINMWSINSADTPAPRRIMHTTLSLIRSRYLSLGIVALLLGISILTINFTNEYLALDRETPLAELPSFNSMLNRTGIAHEPSETFFELPPWPEFMEHQFYRVGAMSLPYALSPPNLEVPNMEYREVLPRLPLPRLSVILGIAVSGASLIGLRFIRRHKILMASLTLSGFCWALAMRYTTGTPWHNFEAVFYIGAALTLFSLILLPMHKLTGDRFVVALSVVALLIFVASAWRVSQLNNANQTAELHQAVISDFESIRNMTDEEIIQTGAMPKFHQGVHALFHYYLAGRITMSERAKEWQYARMPDVIVTSAPIYGLASLTPQNQIVFLYERDDYYMHIDKIIEQADEPIIRSHFDVYRNDNNLIYIKDGCSGADISPWFFLALYPVDESDLPAERRQRGFDNLDFHFFNKIVQRYERCIAVAQLPDYDIARIYTGQYTIQPDGSTEHLWEGDIRLTEAVN